MTGDIEFDWDEENTEHLAKHKVTRAEFEQVMNNDPMDRDYELADDEERFRSVGVTNGGRMLSALWTVRHGKIRPISAFNAPLADKKAFRERLKRLL